MHVSLKACFVLTSCLVQVQDPFTYELNAAGSCLTEDRSEQTLVYNHARAHHHSHQQPPMKPLLFSSPTGGVSTLYMHAHLCHADAILDEARSTRSTSLCNINILCAGDYRPGTSYGISPTGRSHIALPVDMSTPDSHMWMAQEGEPLKNPYTLKPVSQISPRHCTQAAFSHQSLHTGPQAQHLQDQPI